MSVQQNQSITDAQVARMPGNQDVLYQLDRAPFTRYFWNGQKMAALLSVDPDGNVAGSAGEKLALVETSSYVTLAASAVAFNGPCELSGWICTVAAGTIAIYDGTSAAGTLILPPTALVAGPMPIMGPGTSRKLELKLGCYVVLSGAATVNVLVN